MISFEDTFKSKNKQDQPHQSHEPRPNACKNLQNCSLQYTKYLPQLNVT